MALRFRLPLASSSSGPDAVHAKLGLEVTSAVGVVAKSSAARLPAWCGELRRQVDEESLGFRVSVFIQELL